MRDEHCFNSETGMAGIICQGFRMLCKTHMDFQSLQVASSRGYTVQQKGFGLIPAQLLIAHWDLINVTPCFGLNFPSSKISKSTYWVISKVPSISDHLWLWDLKMSLLCSHLKQYSKGANNPSTTVRPQQRLNPALAPLLCNIKEDR